MRAPFLYGSVPEFAGLGTGLIRIATSVLFLVEISGATVYRRLPCISKPAMRSDGAKVLLGALQCVETVRHKGIEPSDRKLYKAASLQH